jgi:hypothetical protein
MEKFLVKIASEQEAKYVLNLAFSFGWKWFDDENAVTFNGQTVKNEHARYIYFGYKGAGLLSWFNRVKKNIPPANVFNVQAHLPTIITYMKENEVLHVGADEVEVDGDVVVVGCKKFDSETVLEVLELSKRISSLPDAFIFHANGDITNHNRRISAYLLQEIANRVI